MTAELHTELPVAEPDRVRRAFTALLRSERARVGFAITLRVAAAGASTAAPLLMGRMIDALAAGQGVEDVDVLALGMAAAIVLAVALTWAASYTANRVGERLSARLRERFVERVLQLPLHTAEQAGSGDLMTRTSVDVPEGGNLIRDVLPRAMVAILTALVYVVAMMFVNAILAACMVLAIPLIAIGARWYLKRARAGYLRQARAESRAGEALAATADGARTAELYRLTDARIASGDATIAGHWAANKYTLYLRSVYFLTLESSYVLPASAVLVLGGALYFNGTVSLGEVATCAVLARQVMTPLNFLLMMVERLQRGFASLARVEGVAMIDAEEAAGTTAAPADGTVELRGVTFAYPTGSDVLHDVDLRIPAGERLAVVGPSGAGKSTIARLVSGTDTPKAGRVTIGGVDVATLPLGERRGHVTLVTQEHHVFTATLRDNLTLAKPDAADAELRAALDAVGATWATDLDLELGGTAKPLDAAAAQQIALARIVLADPDVVILDEATAMLDPRAARDTERALAAVLKGRTVIGIAHRLHTAHDADRIAVVEAGRLVELGSHTELLEADGPYAGLWRSWHGTGSR
ncbi:ABC transporter ATP-binding protein/permease [Glycomyces sp. TRM65418]|uniref:ABC transporter ATP-binding protein n=1 Tax=Glycomyces sp. TRM65418 TaxID=2867006 RepID=UPI001CE4E174|nr:ABC transporter ATP-binding protein [Glycomyces sp. TRM65418]MCC3765408.1 ABC transporter ATP-binding protein/permease [Glycomyces sp. TRM65418]QZD55019.1 ABC transporter ATP-binding protein/permease [Glycomyces sp. TRM65418]